ncbi:hypothetical protein [Streptomyces chattanoogensis]|uniref:hypothetical protein n=1 Tax=Streptomyces chattanoogensis TaxID=66876 RepID=UPI003CCBFDA7
MVHGSGTAGFGIRFCPWGGRRLPDPEFEDGSRLQSAAVTPPARGARRTGPRGGDRRRPSWLRSTASDSVRRPEFCRIQASPRRATAGARWPAMEATMSRTCRVSATSWTR